MKQARWTATRALRNVARNPMRAGLMVALLAVGISLALVMLTVDEAFADRLTEIEGNVGTEVTVRPAGSLNGFAAFAQGEDAEPVYLTDEEVAAVAAQPNVTTVERTIQETGAVSDLAASIPDELLERFGGELPAFASGGGGAFGGVTVIGTDAQGALSLPNGGTAEVAEGRGFTADDDDANIALVGLRLAEDNGLTVGSTFMLQGETVEIVGLFSSETVVGDNAVFLPFGTTQRLFGLDGQVSQVTALVDNAENVALVADSLRATLGAEVVDITTSIEEFDEISGSLESARSSSRIALIASLIASVAVILFVTALVTRQRVREIGILKAVGASGWHVGLQFGVETLVVALAAAVAGALITFPTAQAVADGMVSDSGGGGGFGGGFGGGGFPGGGVGIAAARATGAVDVAVTPVVFLYAVALAAGLALIASCVPAWRVSTIRPAEVLRYE